MAIDKSEYISNIEDRNIAKAYIFEKLGDTYKFSIKFDEAKKYYNESFHYFTALNYDIESNISLMKLGTICWLQTNNDEALTHYNQSLKLFNQIKNEKFDYYKAYILSYIGIIYYEKNDIKRGNYNFELAKKLFQKKSSLKFSYFDLNQFLQKNDMLKKLFFMQYRILGRLHKLDSLKINTDLKKKEYKKFLLNGDKLISEIRKINCYIY